MSLFQEYIWIQIWIHTQKHVLDISSKLFEMPKTQQMFDIHNDLIWLNGKQKIANVEHLFGFDHLNISTTIFLSVFWYFFSLSHDILANSPLLFIVVDAMASKYVKYNIQVPYLTPQWKPKDKAFAQIKLPHSMKTNLSDSPVITNQLNIRISNCTSSWVSTLLFVTHPFHSDKTIHEAIVQSSSDSYTIYCKLSNKRHVYRCIKHLR